MVEAEDGEEVVEEVVEEQAESFHLVVVDMEVVEDMEEEVDLVVDTAVYLGRLLLC